MITIYLSALLLISIVSYFWKAILERIRLSYYAWFLPGPPIYIPIINNAIDFLNKTTQENFEYISRMEKKYKPIFRFWLDTGLIVVGTNLEFIEKVLGSSTLLEKAPDNNALRPWLWDGLLLSDGIKWSNRRKILTPAFHFSKLDYYIETFDNETNAMVQKLNKIKSKECIDFHDILTLCSLDIIVECTLGKRVNAQVEGSSGYEIAKITEKLTESVVKRVYDSFKRHEFFWKYSEDKKYQDGLIKKLQDFTTEIIVQRRKELLNSGAIPLEFHKRTDVYNTNKNESFLDILLQTTIDGKPLSDAEVREEVDTFIFEGHDTTKSALLFTLFHIAKYPDVQQKCFNEIKVVFGSDKTARTTMDHLNDLHYLELVIKESLRLFPPVPIIGRKSTEDIKLSTGQVLPSGCTLLLLIYSIGRCEKLYSDPEIFKPERFEMGDSQERFNAFQFITFSAGRRNCIGQKFAILQMKTTISKILRNFELTLSNETINSKLTVTFEVTLKPTSEMKFYVKDRFY